MTGRLPFIPYPPIEKHGVIGDRRTAALVAADGTLDWLCLPDYDGESICAALLDAKEGGYWRCGPSVASLGEQRYLEESAALVTTWATRAYELELTDIMAWPQDERPDTIKDSRVVLRRLRCQRGEASCALLLYPRTNFLRAASVMQVSGGLELRVGSFRLGVWSTHPLQEDVTGVQAHFCLRAGEEAWMVVTLQEWPDAWSLVRAQQAVRESTEYWPGALSNLTYSGPRRDQARRSAMVLHLLSYAPDGSLVAAPTTSLPERLGGERNYDYRFAWVRDASLSLGALSLLGDTETATRYLDLLLGLGALTEMPLQVVYGLSGGLDLAEHERWNVNGYRGSLPVREGNRAYKQYQRGSLGYLVDCAELHLRAGGSWHEGYWNLVRKIVDFIAATWQVPDSGIWELPTEAQYVSSKVLDWVALDRGMKIAQRLGHSQEVSQWPQVRERIHADVMEKGWSERLGAFRQHYDGEGLDASALLIPVTGFLPANHPRVLSTVRRIEEALTIDGFVYRFQPSKTPGYEDVPVGEFEGAFLPCTFWLATTYAMQGRVQDATDVLARVERIAGNLGLFAEEADPRTGSFLGNTPLLFSHMEYVRAIVALAKAQEQSR
ncbi:MAG TPA: glycoside hydrolase family 15 protein [Ktedonobacterales bacterium]|nr:glycoside hydrolase family 15 protein [Ktedonobacterales bacterium]